MCWTFFLALVAVGGFFIVKDIVEDSATEKKADKRLRKRNPAA